MRTVLRVSNNAGQASSLSLSRSRQAGSLSYIVAALTVTLYMTGCSPQPNVTAPQDKPLASYQTNLLQTAFTVATAMPVSPHIKDRSKAQAAVVDVCFKLDQPQRALGYVEKTGNWRRGAGYADYAFYSVQHGFTNDMQLYLNRAEELASIADQDWRRDRIRVKISKTHTLLGHDEQAELFSTDIDVSESGNVAQVEAALCEEDSFDSQIESLDALFASGNFDLVKNSLYAGTELFNRFYDSSERRGQVEEKIKAYASNAQWGGV